MAVGAAWPAFAADPDPAPPNASAAASGQAPAGPKRPSIAEALGSASGAQDWFWIGGSVVLRNPINLTTRTFPGVGISYSLNLSFRITDVVMGCIDLSAATPISAFNPSPSFGVGPAFLVARRFVINPELLYSASLDYASASAPAPDPGTPPPPIAHSLGASVALAFLRPPIIFAPVLIGSYNVTTQQWFAVFALKIGFMLAAF